jgi:hypothetical protein
VPILIAALAALLLVGGGAIAWGVLGDNDGGGATLMMPEGPSGESAGQPGKPDQQWEPELFTTCGDAYCPVEPMCWGGMTAASGVPLPPRKVDCEEPHYWETFRAVPLPAGGVTIDSDAPLIERADLAEACSAQAMTSRSAEPAKTRRWQRDVWPIPVGADTTLHCIASAPGGESTGGYFRKP